MWISQIEIEQAQSRREREIAERICAAQLQLESQSIRRAVGRSIMSIGAWLAAEPQPRLARSR